MPRKGTPARPADSARRGRHGGPRDGKPGTAYSNRSDMTQAPRAVPAATYGDRTAQIQAQRAIPLPQQAPPPAPGGGAPAGTPPPAGALPMPGPIDAPTANPNQPLTAGIASGAGPGPEALGSVGLSPIDEIRAMFMADPNDDMRRLLGYLDGGF